MSDRPVFDRHNLACLNLVEKINCAYCACGDGESYRRKRANLRCDFNHSDE